MIYLDDDIVGFDLEAVLPMLSEERRERTLRYRHELERKTCAMAYLLLCRGLRQEYRLTDAPLFDYNEYGKPTIMGHPEIHFSLSHCKVGVVCALDNKPIGIDIESIKEYSESLACYTMNDREMQEIAASERPDVAFTRLWTMKEAVLKWNGTGITNDIKDTLKGTEGIETIVNEKKGYVFSVKK